MNANEVISNRAIEIIGSDRFDAKKPIHPNDHVNMGQSTNDMFPTAIHVAAAAAMHKDLIPALQHFHGVLADKAKEWDDIIKIGRTHLADATPIRLGQEISGYARQIERSIHQATEAQHAVMELPAGGTAVGTGINTHPKFGAKVAEVLHKETGVAVCRSEEPLRSQRLPRWPGGVLRLSALHRRHAFLRRQQHPLARLRPALRLL